MYQFEAITAIGDTFRGRISNSFGLVVPGHVPHERPRNCKVSETRLTVSGNQDVVLGDLSISVGVHLTFRPAYPTNATV